MHNANITSLKPIPKIDDKATVQLKDTFKYCILSKTIVPPDILPDVIVAPRNTLNRYTGVTGPTGTNAYTGLACHKSNYTLVYADRINANIATDLINSSAVIQNV